MKLINLIGVRFERLIVVERVENDKLNKIKYKCLCDCGKFTISTRADLRSGDKKSCGCLRVDKLTIDLTGKKFGRLLIIEKSEKPVENNGSYWKCKCDCGKEHVVNTRAIRSAYITSCGCLKEEDIENIQQYYEKFYNDVEKTDGCWVWKGRKSTSGYGIFYAQKMMKAHRFSYMLCKGFIEKNKILCHTCDNRACVNPDHLYQGTHQDNVNDMIQRGRNKTLRGLDGRFLSGDSGLIM